MIQSTSVLWVVCVVQRERYRGVIENNWQETSQTDVRCVTQDRKAQEEVIKTTLAHIKRASAVSVRWWVCRAEGFLKRTLLLSGKRYRRICGRTNRTQSSFFLLDPWTPPNGTWNNLFWYKMMVLLILMNTAWAEITKWASRSVLAEYVCFHKCWISFCFFCFLSFKVFKQYYRAQSSHLLPSRTQATQTPKWNNKQKL